MIVSTNLGRYGAFAGEWEDYCDRTYGGAGGDPNLLNKCKQWSVFAPWTAAGKSARGLPVDWVKVVQQQITQVVNPPVVAPPPSPPAAIPTIPTVVRPQGMQITPDTLVIPGLNPQPPAYVPAPTSLIPTGIIAAGAVGLAAFFMLGKGKTGRKSRSRR